LILESHESLANLQDPERGEWADSAQHPERAASLAHRIGINLRHLWNDPLTVGAFRTALQDALCGSD